MKLQKYLTILPLVVATLSASAEVTTTQSNPTVFHLSAEVNRSIEKDLLEVEVYSSKSGKNLAELKKYVGSHIAQVIDEAKKYPGIEVASAGAYHFNDYDQKGKATGWRAESRLKLKSKDFNAVADVLAQLPDQVAIRYLEFSVSPEKVAEIEDELVLAVIKQFQHKARVVQQGLNAKTYHLRDVELHTPNGTTGTRSVGYAKNMALRADQYESQEFPFEAGKTTVSAIATGKVVFE